MTKITMSNQEEIISGMTPKRDFIFKRLFGTVGRESTFLCIENV